MQWRAWAVLAVLTGCSDDVSGTGSGSTTGDDPTTGSGSTTIVPEPTTLGESTTPGESTTLVEPTTGGSTVTSGGQTTLDPSSSSGTTDDSPECLAVAEPSPVDCDFAPPVPDFTPTLQWSFTPEDGRIHSWATPLVGNLTDDDGDGAIDLHDTPDVVLLAFAPGTAGALYVVDGATGALHLQIPDAFPMATPAIGDIDGDGLMEIVVQDRSGQHLVAYEHDGALKWRSEPLVQHVDEATTNVALADLDNDCDVEILFLDMILDHDGQLVHKFKPWPMFERSPAAADIDGDGDLEVLLSDGVYHHDGTILLQPPEWYAGVSEAADFDGDGLPEILFSSLLGLTLMEHDGTIVFETLDPLDQEYEHYMTPSAVYDLDHDGLPEFLKGNVVSLNAHRGDGSVLWSAPVDDDSTAAVPTVFDLLGGGSPLVLHADEHALRVFDAAGAALWEVPRPSITGFDIPVVADVDNDGAAEIVVVSTTLSHQDGPPPPTPTLRVFRDVEDRWMPARRIWNQQAYHVTNVREDGTIPQFETPPWQGLGTLGVQAHVGPAGVCNPPSG